MGITDIDADEPKQLECSIAMTDSGVSLVQYSGGYRLSAYGLLYLDNVFAADADQDMKDAFKQKYQDAGTFITDSDLAVLDVSKAWAFDSFSCLGCNDEDGQAHPSWMNPDTL